MNKVDKKDESAPIVTATRVPPKKFESDNESSNDEYPPTLTATRVS